MLERSITLQLKQEDGQSKSVLYVQDKNIVIIDGVEVDTFIIVEKAFNQIYSLVKRADQEFYIESFMPLNAIHEEAIYTVTDDGTKFPIGFVHSGAMPEVGSLILTAKVIRESGENTLYGLFELIGEVVTLDAR